MAVRRRTALIAISVAGALAVLSVADARGFRRYLELQDGAASLKARNEKLRAENERLRGEIESLRDDPAALERAAREELGFVRPGEIVLNVE